MTTSPHHEYFRRFEALTAGPELRVAEGMTDRLGWEEPAPAGAGGYAALYPWRTRSSGLSTASGLPRFLAEKEDWLGIFAPDWVIARLSDAQRRHLRFLAVAGSSGAAPVTLGGSYPALERLHLMIDADFAEPLPKLWSVVLAMEARPVLAQRWLADCRLEHVEAKYPAKVDWRRPRLLRST